MYRRIVLIVIIHLADTISSIEFEEDKNENDDFIKRYENKLARELAVRVDGYQFTKPYKLGVWDGYTSTYDKTNHTFPTGLQDQVEQFNKEWQRSELLYYSYVDERGEAFLDEEDFPDKVSFIKGDKELTLRDYQYGSVKAGIMNRSGIVHLSVNSGKTADSVGIINVLKPYLETNEKVAYIVPSKNIFEQALETMREQYGDKAVGYLGNGKEKLSQINVMMMQSLFSKLKEPDTGLKLTGKNREYQIFAQEIYPLFDNKTNLVANLRRFLKNYNTKGVSYKEHLKQSLLELAYSDNITDAKIKLQFNKEYVKYDKLVQKKVGNKWKKYQEYQDMVKNTKVVILDEAHHIKADTYYNTILKFTNATYKFGMTGSIDKKDKLLNLRLKAIFKDVVYKVSNQEMIDRGISAKPTVNMINITKPEGIMSKRNFTGGYVNGHYDEGVYVTGIVKNDYRNKIIVNFAKALVDSGKQTLIIVNHMEHGDRITTELRKLGINVEFTHGEVDKSVRTEQMAKAKAGELDVLVATSVLDEGVDISGFRALIMAGGYKSLRLVLQRVGRILRKKETDNTALVYDFMDRQNVLTFSHSSQRLKIYQNEGFDIKYLN